MLLIPIDIKPNLKVSEIMKSIIYKISLVWLVCLTTFCSGLVMADEVSQEQLDQMMAPVALYPDALLSQILMAATYPDEVSQAAKWSKDNVDQQGDDAVTAVADKQWDPSVASLVAFPQVLDMMGGKPDWVKQMGDAFLADSAKVMETVQNLRKKAKEEGNLKTSDQQTVATQGSTITIVPTDPQVIYVPAYNPSIIYGPWWYPSYPPYYYPPPPRYGFGAGFVIGFGFGMIVHNSLWGGFNWGHGSVNINVNRYNNINVNHRISSNNKNVSWKRDSTKRGSGVSRKGDSKKAISRKADARKDFRGRDAQRANALSNMKSQGLDPSKGRAKLSGAGGDKIRNKVNKQNNLSNFKAKPSKRNSNKASTYKRKSGNAFSGMSRKSSHSSKLSSRRGAASHRSFKGRASHGRRR